MSYLVFVWVRLLKWLPGIRGFAVSPYVEIRHEGSLGVGIPVHSVKVNDVVTGKALAIYLRTYSGSVYQLVAKDGNAHLVGGRFRVNGICGSYRATTGKPIKSEEIETTSFLTQIVVIPTNRPEGIGTQLPHCDLGEICLSQIQ